LLLNYIIQNFIVIIEKGNNLTNKIESDLTGEKPNKDSHEETRREWILQKYTKLGVINANTTRDRLKNKRQH